MLKKCFIDCNFYFKENKCALNPCQNGGTCTQYGNSFNCSCPQYYHGLTCITCKIIGLKSIFIVK